MYNDGGRLGKTIGYIFKGWQTFVRHTILRSRMDEGQSRIDLSKCGFRPAAGNGSSRPDPGDGGSRPVPGEGSSVPDHREGGSRPATSEDGYRPDRDKGSSRLSATEGRSCDMLWYCIANDCANASCFLCCSRASCFVWMYVCYVHHTFKQ